VRQATGSGGRDRVHGGRDRGGAQGAAAARGYLAAARGHGAGAVAEAGHGCVPQVRLRVSTVHGRGPVPFRAGEACGGGQQVAIGVGATRWDSENGGTKMGRAGGPGGGGGGGEGG